MHYPHAPGPLEPLIPQTPEYLRCNHLLHLILSCITGGLWLFIWPLTAARVASRNRRASRQYHRALNQYQIDMALWRQHNFPERTNQ